MAVNSGFTQGVKNNWKAIVWGLVPIVILVIVFALPLKVVPIQVTETYTDTEMQSQPYTTQETYQEQEPYTVSETKTDTVYDTYVNSGTWSYSFAVDKPGSTVSISTQGSPSVTYYQPYYFVGPDDTDGPSMYPYYPYFWWYDSYGGRNRVVIKVSYPSDVTKYRTVTKTRDVVKYHDVSVQVQKERTVTKYVRMSIWQYLFSGQQQYSQLPAAQ